MTITAKRMTVAARCRTRAFTLLESLCVLALMTFFILSLSGSVKTIFARVEENLFFLSFEQLYRQTQKLAISRQRELVFSIDQDRVTNQERSVPLPAGVSVDRPYQLKISKAGGNSSLSRVVFTSRGKNVTYQFYLGSGNYKKTTD